VLGFATVGIFLMYLGFKYNSLFVFTTVVSTNGAAYPRALQHLMVGVYIGEICLLGLFGIKAAAGPLVLLGVLLVVTIIFHVLLNRAINPMLKYLPLAIFDNHHVNPQVVQTSIDGRISGAEEEKLRSSQPNPPGSFEFLYKLFHIDPVHKSAPTSSGNMLSRFIHVNTYASRAQLEEYQSISNFSEPYNEKVLQEAYFNPAITSEVPVVWIAKDPLGISTEEISKTDEIIPISDDGAYINEKNKVVWDRENCPEPVIKKSDFLY